ncbi:MAG: ABC transporter permease [Chloroflexia bacterium]|nr:ABC transporter permease [Chloroflexia bacterium]
MNNKPSFSTTAGWSSLVLGGLLSIPWLAALLAFWIGGEDLSGLVILIIALGAPLTLGLPLLGRARSWLEGPEFCLALVYMGLGGLWTLAGLLSVLLYGGILSLLDPSSANPLGLLLLGIVPAVVGLAYFSQAARSWPAERVRFRMWGGWIYYGAAGLTLLWSLLQWGRGESLLLSGLVQAALLLLLAATQFERPVQSMGAFFCFLGLSIGLLFLPSTELGLLSVFVLNPGGRVEAWSVGNVVFPSGASVAMLAVIAAGLGLWQAVRQLRRSRWIVAGALGLLVLVLLVSLGLHYGLSTATFLLVILSLTLGASAWQLLRSKATNGVLGAILLLFILAFLIWAGRGKEFNFTGILISMLGAATPIALGALSGVWCERSAVINIAIEGMMLSAAFTSVVVGSVSQSLVLALLVGMLTGGLLAALLAVLAIRFKVDQIIAGTAINIFAVGATSFLAARLLVERQSLNASEHFAPVSLPVLSRIPVLGPVLFQNNLIVYLMLLLVVVTHIVLFYTRWGLRTRAVGEHPLAADTLGVNVFVTRYINVIIGGLIAGLGGSYFTIGSVGRFDELMTAGRGFIGLAAMIFGRWNPFGAFASSLIFGFADASAAKLGILKVPISSYFLLMAPYLATIVVLAGIIGRAVPPAADGEPYEKH